MMQLRFYGTGAAFNPALGSNGAIFAHGEDLYLLDCGESAFHTLMRAGVLDGTAGQITVLLTHLHSDHCGSLGSLCLYAAERLNRPATVVHPSEQARALLGLMGVAEDKYRLVSSLDERGVKVTPMPVRHLQMTAFGYLLEDGEETVYYSGDAAEIRPEIIEAAKAGRIDRVYQDVSALDGPPPENPTHLPLSVLKALVSGPLRSKFHLMHYNRAYRAEAEGLGFSCVSRDPMFD